MNLMRQVDISPIDPTRLANVIGPERWSDFAQTAADMRRLLGSRTVWNVNATPTGGGVAEMLPILLGYGLGCDIDNQWLVLDGETTFFNTTKRIHNVLHGVPGDGGELGPAERANYEQVLAQNLADTEGQVEPGDVVLLHDPQTAGLIPGYRERGCTVVWRSHIGRDEPNEHTERGWAFLEPYLEGAQKVVCTRPSYKPPSVPADKLIIIPPSIDPFATKNRDIDQDTAVATLVRVGLLEGEDHSGPIHFVRRDGTQGRLRHLTGLLSEGGPLPAGSRVILQVSRWDRLKDMPGVMTGFTDHLDAPDDAHLVLCGPAVEGVSDDPEGAEVLAECRELWRNLPAAVQDRVHLVCVPMDDTDENAHVINALQRYSYAVVQKSLFEGFGLTVTEAMWKARPVIASAVGGIQDQIIDGECGLLLADPLDYRSLGAAMKRLLDDPELANRLGTAARERVRTEFIGDTHLRRWADVLSQVLPAE